MAEDKQTNYVELPRDAEDALYSTMATVQAKERGDLIDSPLVSGKGIMLFTMLVLSALTAQMAHSYVQKDKALFETHGKLLTASNTLNEKTMMTLNQVKLEKSLKTMKEAVRQRTALNKIQAQLMATHTEHKTITDENARELLLRAGYLPSEIDEKKINKVQNRYQNLNTSGSKVDQDVDFAKHVASDIVRDEVEDFANKVRMLTVVGGYIFDRVTEEE